MPSDDLQDNKFQQAFAQGEQFEVELCGHNGTFI
jgi:hypothetical protein